MKTDSGVGSVLNVGAENRMTGPFSQQTFERHRHCHLRESTAASNNINNGAF